jgi:hypothetical protein
MAILLSFFFKDFIFLLYLLVLSGLTAVTIFSAVLAMVDFMAALLTGALGAALAVALRTGAFLTGAFAVAFTGAFLTGALVAALGVALRAGTFLTGVFAGALAVALRIGAFAAVLTGALLAGAFGFWVGLFSMIISSFNYDSLS